MLKIEDFENTSKNEMTSKCKKYRLQKDDCGYFYPCRLFYKKRKPENNFYSYVVNTGFDYSFSFEHALEVLNMVIAGTWKTGEGRHLNGLSYQSR
jgi:plasmid maintenance system killer protein